jgi:gamma-glutamylputrescine oxidase
MGYSTAPESITETRSAAAEREDISLWGDLSGSFVNSFKSQGNGAIQLLNKAGANISEFEAEQVSDAKFGSAAWGAQMAGKIAATALEFAALRFLFRGAAGKLAGMSTIEATKASSFGVMGNSLINGGTGAVMGFALTPTYGENFWMDRLKNGATEGLAFTGMGLVSSGLGKASLVSDSRLISGVLGNGVFNNAAGGFVGGAISAEVGSRLAGNGSAGWQTAGQRGIEYALVGVGAHGFDVGANALQARFTAKPTLDGPQRINFSDLPKPSIWRQKSLEHERSTPSSWFDDAAAHKRFPTLKQNESANVVVVGGGIAGLQVARELTQHGYQTTLIDGQRIAGGTTAQMAGMVERMPDWGFAKLQKLYGETTYPRIMRELNEAHQSVIDSARGTNSDFRLVDTYKLGSRLTNGSLKSEVAAAQPYDPHIGFLSGKEATGIFPGTQTAGVLRQEGQLHPRKFALEIAEQGGFKIFEDTPAIGVTVGRPGEPVQVHTPEGTLTANRVVFATNQPSPMFQHLNEHVWGVQIFGLRARHNGKVDANYISSREPIIDFWRQMGEGHILFGGSGRPLFALPPTTSPRSVVGRLDKFYPEAVPENVWSGTIFTNKRDGLPIVAQHPQFPNLYDVSSFGGSGLVNSAFAAKMLRLELEGKGDLNLLSPRRFD